MRLALLISIFAGLMCAGQAQEQDQSIRLRDAHRHAWDDLRMRLVTVTEIDGEQVRWKHTTPYRTDTGQWRIGVTLRVHKRGIRAVKVGREYIGVYCAQPECNVALWLYESEGKD